jgi:hypothetical protein
MLSAVLVESFAMISSLIFRMASSALSLLLQAKPVNIMEQDIVLLTYYHMGFPSKYILELASRLQHVPSEIFGGFVSKTCVGTSYNGGFVL